MIRLAILVILSGCASDPRDKEPLEVVSVGRHETFRTAELACENEGMTLASTDEAFSALLAQAAANVESSHTANRLGPQAVWEVTDDPAQQAEAARRNSVVFIPAADHQVRQRATLEEFRSVLEASPLPGEGYLPSNGEDWQVMTFCSR